MLFKIGVSLLFLLPALIAAAPKPLPPCGDKNVACRCPSGTTFGNYTTFVTIAALVKDVYGVTGDCKSLLYTIFRLPISYGPRS